MKLLLIVSKRGLLNRHSYVIKFAYFMVDLMVKLDLRHFRSVFYAIIPTLKHIARVIYSCCCVTGVLLLCDGAGFCAAFYVDTEDGVG
jgi:hypothetical protein